MKRVIEMVVVLAFVLAGAAQAQTTTTTETKSFEILSVDGNVLVIREPSGTREVEVPSDFRFNVDGKSLGVADLKPGMKGTAKVTKTTIFHPVYVTEVRNVTVAKTLGGSVVVQYPDGTFKMFSQGQLDEHGVKVVMDGKPLKVEDMQVGDHITATVFTEGPPQKLSKTEVDVALAKAAAAVKAAPKMTAEPTTTAPPPAEMSAADTTAPPPDTAVAMAPDTTAAPVPASKNSMLIWLGLIFLILVVILVLRRRSKR